MKTSSHHCAEKNCNEYIHREISRYWCEKHEAERRSRLTNQMESILNNFPKETHESDN